jgi:Tfp pilus assembly protein PilO
MTRTNRILAAVVAAGLAAFAFYYLALAPQREEAARLDGQIAKKTAEIAAAKGQLANYEQAKASYRRNYATLARLGKAVPGDDDVRSLLVQLENAADRSGVDFEKIELGSGLGGAATAQPAAGEKPAEGLAPAPGAVPVANGVLSAMPFSFTFTGSYFDLSSFLARLERFVTVNNRKLDATGRLLRLESVAVTPAAKGFPQMQAQINAATYLVPPVEAVAGAPKPTTPPAAGATQASSGGTTTTASATTGATQ